MKNFKIIIIIFLTQILNILICLANNTVLYKTPFCHQPINYNTISNKEWTADDVEYSVQLFLYRGGLLKMNTEGNTFIEKNNHLLSRHGTCMNVFNNLLFYGTEDDGLYYTPFYNSGKINWLHHDTRHALNGQKINNLLIESYGWFACTNNGIFKSSDEGTSWVQSESGCIVNCIIYDGYSSQYMATNHGVFKSTDAGNIWVQIRPSYINSNTIIWDNINNRIYIGTENNGLQFSTDGGDSWSTVPDPYNYCGSITAIIKEGDNIYVGTRQNGFWRYNGNNWTEYNNSLPKNYTTTFYYTINSMKLFTLSTIEYFWVASDLHGIYRLNKNSLSSPWEPYEVRGDISTQEELDIKSIYLNGNDFWVVCKGDPLFSDVEVIYNQDSTWHQSNWGNFNCHHLAWHFMEGGITGAGGMSDPKYLHYISYDDYDNNKNFDYILTDSNDNQWEKITYDWGHSGIYYPYFPSYKIISKWGNTGPLVLHSKRDNPYQYPTTQHRFWKSTKILSSLSVNDIHEPDDENPNKYCCIGRVITTAGDIIIPYNESIDFFVAPMKSHKINLKPGFHAEYGSKIHVFVKTGCQIPWEEIQSVPKVSVIPEIDGSVHLNNSKLNAYQLQLFINPNPSYNKIVINSKIINYNKDCRINLSLISLKGEIIKEISVNNYEEIAIDLQNIISGSYLLAANAYFIDEFGESKEINDTKLIVIEK
ncbi:MAG: BNR/Asp-box repeat protein [Ignavibacteria bacterium]|nr:BNR/Asp-box repeat protein [Ignavibacteria bacterium]